MEVIEGEHPKYMNEVEYLGISNEPKLLSVEAVSMQIDMKAIEDAENYITHTPPTIIRLAHLRDVVDAIIKEEITMSKGAEILNKVAVDYYKEKQNESNKTI